ncbi:MAG: beta-ketoacyl-ACP synthase III [Clostridiaceae bacterium]
MSIQIISTGSYLPELIVSNDDMTSFLDTSDEWITSRSGIKSRHIAAKETTTYMGAKAAKLALERSGLKPEDIDLIVCATLTPDTFAPMVAANIQKELGIESAAAFDMNANCSGFIYAVTIAESMMKNCGYKNSIVVGSDANSQILDWSDRATCVLFGDGAGAVVLSDNEKRGIISSYLNCIPDKDEALSRKCVLYKTPFFNSERTEDTKVKMKGQNVMRFAVRACIEAVEIVMKKADVSMEDIKFIVPHQANKRIIDTAAKTMGVDINKFFVNIDMTGNTSSATIPIALDEMIRNNLIKRGDLIMFVAFGGGLSSGAILLEW